MSLRKSFLREKKLYGFWLPSDFYSGFCNITELPHLESLVP